MYFRPTEGRRDGLSVRTLKRWRSSTPGAGHRSNHPLHPNMVHKPQPSVCSSSWLLCLCSSWDISSTFPSLGVTLFHSHGSDSPQLLLFTAWSSHRAFPSCGLKCPLYLEDVCEKPSLCTVCISSQLLRPRSYSGLRLSGWSLCSDAVCIGRGAGIHGLQGLPASEPGGTKASALDPTLWEAPHPQK